MSRALQAIYCLQAVTGLCVPEYVIGLSVILLPTTYQHFIRVIYWHLACYYLFNHRSIRLTILQHTTTGDECYDKKTN